MQRRHRRQHSRIWLVLALLLPAVLLAGLAVRTAQHADHPPLRLAPPALAPS
jgi:hypothetical protein